MPARLIAVEDEHTILLDKPILLIGRHEECDIQLESSKVSRKHCCIAQIENYLIVRDLDSTNGVRINNQPVSEGKLQSGDELMIGNIRYRLTWDDEAAADGPSRSEAAANGAAPYNNVLSCEIPVAIREAKPRPPLGGRDLKTARDAADSPPPAPPPGKDAEPPRAPN